MTTNPELRKIVPEIGRLSALQSVRKTTEADNARLDYLIALRRHILFPKQYPQPEVVK